ncbi:ROK family protein [Microbacterium sp. MPKO10]|uniref:ROK family protein n=1 Tax=Microbacterium sp. MPKO10 TaxID=2989818 RepID=UPI002236903D|nr:ROK family protein [Microbacterium sp. MPKO10]MCW4459215.1 ROK family protein [Microbacterium sp. MPKO10]
MAQEQPVSTRGPLNASAILRFAWDSPAFTASDAMSATHLTRSTVIALCDLLVAEGWLRELENARAAGEYSKGRPARRYVLRADAGVVVGLDAGQHHLTAIVSDLSGRELARVQSSANPDSDIARERLAAADGSVNGALQKAGVTSDRVLCIVVGVPAPTDADGHSPEGQNSFWRIMNPGYAEHFSKRGWPTVVENDANLAAIAEGCRGRAAGASSFVTLLSGERFGAGYVVDGRLVRGAQGGAGEMRLLSLVEGVGSPDGIGALARDWLHKAIAQNVVPPSSALAGLPEHEQDARTVFRAADAGDSFALSIIDRIAERLARICAVLAGLLDVERIVVAGAVATSIGPLLERTARRLTELTHPPAPELTASTLSDNVVSIGAVAHALEYARDHALTMTVAPPTSA